jgi:soluble lytic murein transglycosylase-like protein
MRKGSTPHAPAQACSFANLCASSRAAPAASGPMAIVQWPDKLFPGRAWGLFALASWFEQALNKRRIQDERAHRSVRTTRRRARPSRAAAMMRAAVIALLALTAAQAAHGTYICTDDWGRSYELPQPLADQITPFKCRRKDVPPPQPTAQQRLVHAASALGLPQPQAAAPPGGLLLSIIPSSPAARALPATAGGHPTLHVLIADVARRYGHDADLLKAIVHVESRFNPSAVSPKGAIGLMQVMPATGKRMGVDDPKRQLLDPEHNLDAGARYLRLLMQMFPQRLDLAVAAYNAGEGAVLRYNRRIPPYPETQSYVRQVLDQYSRYRAE